VDGSWEVKEPKGRRPRSVPLSADVSAALQAHRRGRGAAALVFPSEDGGYLDRNKVWRTVVQTAKAAGIDRHVHPHLLRHTFASHCYQRGIPPQVVQQWMGHAQISTTERYAHLAPDTGGDLIDLLDCPRLDLAQRVGRGTVRRITNTLTNTKGTWE
jgi:site-specific recombinase XerD